MAMVNYPYASSFIGSLPANPVNVACAAGMQNPFNPDEDQVNGLYKITNVFYNSSGDFKCYDIVSNPSESNDLDSDGWNYQVCNEMVMPIAQSGKTDMFLPQPWDPDQFISDCNTQKSLNP